MILFIFCYALSVACCVKSFVLPVEKCNLEDSECMKIQFQKAIPVFVNGIPEMGIQVLDVMDIDHFNFSLSGFQFSLSDGKLKGLRNAVVDSVIWDVKKKTYQLKYHVLDLFLRGHYTASGKVLIMPIAGEGELTSTFKNIHLLFEIEYEIEKGNDGKDYVVPKKMIFDYDVKDNAKFQATNLFNGDKELSDAMLDFVNENWKQITTEFGKPGVEIAAQIIYKNVKIFFMKNAISDIANYV